MQTKIFKSIDEVMDDLNKEASEQAEREELEHKSVTFQQIKDAIDKAIENQEKGNNQ